MRDPDDNWFNRILSPLFQHVLIDRDQVMAQSDRIDWDASCQRLTNPTVTYPSYYEQAFHGIKDGYRCTTAALSYDPITQYVLPPNETWVRQSLIDAVICQPRRILDLGCGTGTGTLMLKQAFPQAEVIGLDLAVHMLAVAEDKAQQTQVSLQLRHGDAAATGLPPNSIDLITATLLFHETPPAATLDILRECFRLLTPGGQLLVLDGNQAALRQAQWLMEIFHEPYIRDYADGNLDAWFGATGFGAVRSRTVWAVHQLTQGVKPDPRQRPQWSDAAAVGAVGLGPVGA